FYAVQNEAWRSHKLFRHTLGADAANDEELFHEPDELFNVWIDKTRDNAYLIFTSESLETSEAYYLDANDAHGAFTLFTPRQQGVLTYLDHRQGSFFILTNEDAKTFKVMQVPVSHPDKSHWQALTAHNPDKLVESIELFAGHLVINGRSQSLQTLDIHNFNTGETHAVAFPEPVYAIKGSENKIADTDRFRFVYTSLTTSDSVVEVGMNGRSWTLIKQEPVLGNYDPANYATERLWATADDGVKVPLSLVYRKGMVRDGSHPCLLYGYGSYGVSTSPQFDQKRLSLLDRGFIFAIAHIRGGQEMGRHWYDDGKFLHKKNTFTDFIACARHLLAAKYTGRDRLAAMGRSAGGLLMGAVTTMAPELFQAVVAAVPFVDVVTTMLDASLPLTAGEWEEWGNPTDEAFYRYMLSYSPYDNTTAQAYPHLLITAGLNDPRVQYWEPAKWTAKLRTVKTDSSQLLLKVHMGAGHFSSSGRYDYLKDIAFEYVFLLDVLG
ncbi:MAG: S9 family peptidase, partial [Anaerolineae bacterium]